MKTYKFEIIYKDVIVGLSYARDIPRAQKMLRKETGVGDDVYLRQSGRLVSQKSAHGWANTITNVVPIGVHYCILNIIETTGLMEKDPKRAYSKAIIKYAKDIKAWMEWLEICKKTGYT